jgi:serine/threonine protein kinase
MLNLWFEEVLSRFSDGIALLNCCSGLHFMLAESMFGQWGVYSQNFCSECLYFQVFFIARTSRSSSMIDDILFAGNSDLEQLGKIFNVLGTPTSASWPGATLLPGYVEFEAREPMNLMPLFRSSSNSSLSAAASVNGVISTAPVDLDLLLRLLTLNPLKRITATEVCQ